MPNLPDHVLEALREREIPESTIVKMSGKEIFAEYCLWNGMIGWSNRLWETVEFLQEWDKPRSVGSPDAWK